MSCTELSWRAPERLLARRARHGSRDVEGDGRRHGLLLRVRVDLAQPAAVLLRHAERRRLAPKANGPRRRWRCAWVVEGSVCDVGTSTGTSTNSRACGGSSARGVHTKRKQGSATLGHVHFEQAAWFEILLGFRLTPSFLLSEALAVLASHPFSASRLPLHAHHVQQPRRRRRQEEVRVCVGVSAVRTAVWFACGLCVRGRWLPAGPASPAHTL